MHKLSINLFICLLFFLNSSALVYGAEISPELLRGNKKQVKKVAVMQNRFFLKALRPDLGLVGGAVIGDAYTRTLTRGFRAGMFMNEWIGFEFQSLSTSLSDTDDRKALNSLKFRPREIDPENPDRLVSPDPEVNPIYKMQDVSVLWTPFYGKINLLDQAIVYSDMCFSVGV